MTKPQTTSPTGLLDPLSMGALQLPNRVIMSPLTRCRAGEGRVPNLLMAEYYRQRAGAGLILSEATAVTPMGVGYPNTPGIWSDEQTEGWRLVTDAVHKEGGRMCLQLWHVGRISDPIYLHGKLPVAPSALAPEGQVNLPRPKKNYVVPRALELSEIPEIVEHFRIGAKSAQDAGFDGVEIHGANGYLINQFLSPASNHRKDDYGGSVENRVRFLLEVIDAVTSVWGANRVGLHISPGDNSYSVANDGSRSTYEYVAREISARKIAFLCVRESTKACIRYGPSLT
jgi:2,4-dienoyl-CoA reductase-like NADH-dependent reductase (Old Yellow Enzyme family)